MPYLLPQTYKTTLFNYNFLLTLFCLPEPKRASKSVSWKAQEKAVLPISVLVAQVTSRSVALFQLHKYN